MGDQTKFKHIKVNSDIDDDVVIYAGRPSSECQESDRTKPDSSDGQVEVQAEGFGDASDTAQAIGQAAAPEQASRQASAQEPQQAQGQRQAQGSSAPEDDSGYHRTTLADIEGSKMPKAQVITIALALVAIAAFIIWYIVAM